MDEGGGLRALRAGTDTAMGRGADSDAEDSKADEIDGEVRCGISSGWIEVLCTSKYCSDHPSDHLDLAKHCVTPFLAVGCAPFARELSPAPTLHHLTAFY